MPTARPSVAAPPVRGIPLHALHRAGALLLFLVLCSGTARALSEDDAAHLLRRTGFQPAPQELAAWSTLSRNAAVVRLVDRARADAAPDTPLPAWHARRVDVDYLSPRHHDRETIRHRKQLIYTDGLDLKRWWIGEMAASDSPLNERMTLFWSGHFTSSLKKVVWPQWMLRQNQLLRGHALGNYRELLHAIARDPAMLRYLDTQISKREKANENFARELLELFTLGESQYTEQDVKAAARAFTGWRYNAREDHFHVVPRHHDGDGKTFLGVAGPLDGDDVIEIVLRQPRAATFIVERLWREFVSPTPDPDEVTRLAARFRADWDIATLMKGLLSSEAFWSETNRGTLVKSPVELVVGTQRALGLPLPADVGAVAVATMGQSLFDPPNVRGWPSGNDWIDANTYLARRQFLLYLFGEAERLDRPRLMAGDALRTTMQSLPAQGERLREAARGYAERHPTDAADRWLLVSPSVQPPPQASPPPDRLLAWLLDPVYQLK